MSRDADNERASADASAADSRQAALLAERVAMLTRDDAAIQARDLPLWARLGQRQQSGIAGLFWLACWCAVVGLLVVALLRIVAHDTTTLLIWCNAFTAYIYLPAYFVLAAALWKRRWPLAATSAIVVACHLFWVGPDFRPATASAIEDSPAETVRIFYANVRGSNRDYQSVLDEISSSNPDVVIFVEYHHRRAAATNASTVMKPYVYGTPLQQLYTGEVVVFSRLPVLRHQYAKAAGRLVNIVDVEVGNEALRLVALHSHRPLVEEPDLYSRYWQEMDSILDEQTGPLVVIGDFNATQHSAVLARLADKGLRSAHADRGRGYATSWPNGLYPLPPIRIDHALLSPEVECVAIEEGIGAGSDHRPLILDVRIP